MSLRSRIANVFHADRLSRDIGEEIQSHIEEAIAEGRDPAEARRELGSALRHAEESRDIRLVAWLDSLRADARFGWRQLMKRKVISAAAILSLALAIGACTAAFRLIDALLLRPLPVANADRLFSVYRAGIGFDGKPATSDAWAYPAFRLMRAAVKDQADLMAVSLADRMDLTYQADFEIEKAYVQYVSGSMFPTFGLRPTVGRLFTDNDDLQPGAHPFAVLSYDYWSRRFGRDPNVVGRTFRLGERVFEIVGVGPKEFTGTETGIVTAIFLPTMMHPSAVRDDATWHRTLASLKPGVALEPVRATLHATSRAFELERAKGFIGMPRQAIEKFLDQTVMLAPAAAGASSMQKDYRVGLVAIGVLVALVLLIACANVANLMTAQAAARAREMALRVAIGAGRLRLVQLVLVESAWIASLAALTGGWFALWSAPFVVSRMNPADNPARLSLPADWRVFGFGVALSLLVTLLFGLAPALHAAAVNPASTLKGGFSPRSRRRWMHSLIAAQVAFCFVVMFVAGLFVATFDRLSHKPMGFSPERLLAVETVAPGAQPAAFWDQELDRLRLLPGVESAALSSWPLLGGDAQNSFISVSGAPPGPVLAFFLSVSPGWVQAMKLPWIDGRDFRPNETTPGAAIVTETFARQFYGGENPVGKTFARGTNQYRIVGLVRDAPYRHIREPILPVVYVPFHRLDAQGVLAPVRQASFMVRTTSSDALALASIIRQEVPKARAGFRVANIRTEEDLFRGQTVRERLLSMLAMFFAAVALLLAGIGLYGVLDYAVVERRREIGIRMAIGAEAGEIARRVTSDVFAMVLVGAAAGLGLGMLSVESITALLYEVKPADPGMLAIPIVTILAVALVSALPAVLHALRIDPVAMLRSD